MIGVQCYFNRFTLANFLSGLDCFVTLFALIAVIWLRVFERSEDARLNKKICEFCIQLTYRRSPFSHAPLW